MFLQLVTTAQNTLVKILIDKCRRKQKKYTTLLSYEIEMVMTKLQLNFGNVFWESKKELSEILIVLRKSWLTDLLKT